MGMDTSVVEHIDFSCGLVSLSPALRTETNGFYRLLKAREEMEDRWFLMVERRSVATTEGTPHYALDISCVNLMRVRTRTDRSNAPRL